MAGVVVAVAVELHGQAALWPSAVDIATTGRPVRAGERQPVRPEDPQELPLELAQRYGGLPVEDLAQLGHPRDAGPAGDARIDCARAHQVANLCLMAGPGQLVERH